MRADKQLQTLHKGSLCQQTTKHNTHLNTLRITYACYRRTLDKCMGYSRLVIDKNVLKWEEQLQLIICYIRSIKHAKKLICLTPDRNAWYNAKLSCSRDRAAYSVKKLHQDNSTKSIQGNTMSDNDSAWTSCPVCNSDSHVQETFLLSVLSTISNNTQAVPMVWHRSIKMEKSCDGGNLQVDRRSALTFREQRLK